MEKIYHFSSPFYEKIERVINGNIVPCYYPSVYCEEKHKKILVGSTEIFYHSKEDAIYKAEEFYRTLSKKHKS